MEDAPVLAVAEDLKAVADVDDEGVGDRLGSDPLVVVVDLQAGDHVGEDEGEGTHVGVGLDAEGEIRLGAFGVVVDLHLQQELIHPSELLLKPAFLHSQTQRQQG